MGNLRQATAVDEANDFVDGKTFYCDETGARVEKSMGYSSVEPGAADDEADADEYWYYLKKTTGKPATGKQASINGQIYLFDDDGRMLYGWVANSKHRLAMLRTIEQIDLDDRQPQANSTLLTTQMFTTAATRMTDTLRRTNGIKTWLPEDFDDEDEDNDQKWYWFDKNGKVYITTDIRFWFQR